MQVEIIICYVSKKEIMKINFTKKEYRALIDLIYIGNWVITANDVEKDMNKEKYEEVTRKIYSFAKEFGCEKLIEYHPELDEYCGSCDFEESEVSQHLEEYEDTSFWETLIFRLSERDFLKEVPPGELMNIPPEKIIMETHRHEEKWSEEFTKNGIDNLKT